MAVPRTYRKPRLTREPSGGSTSPYCASCADASSGYLHMVKRGENGVLDGVCLNGHGFMVGSEVMGRFS